MTTDDIQELVDQCQFRRWWRPDGTRYTFKIHDCEQRSCKFSYTHDHGRQSEPEGSGGGGLLTAEKEGKQPVDQKPTPTDVGPDQKDEDTKQDVVKGENDAKEEKKVVRFA